MKQDPPEEKCSLNILCILLLPYLISFEMSPCSRPAFPKERQQSLEIIPVNPCCSRSDLQTQSNTSPPWRLGVHVDITALSSSGLKLLHSGLTQDFPNLFGHLYPSDNIKCPVFLKLTLAFMGLHCSPSLSRPQPYRPSHHVGYTYWGTGP